jgi:hypothetical protein
MGVKKREAMDKEFESLENELRRLEEKPALPSKIPNAISVRPNPDSNSSALSRRISDITNVLIENEKGSYRQKFSIIKEDNLAKELKILMEGGGVYPPDALARRISEVVKSLTKGHEHPMTATKKQNLEFELNLLEFEEEKQRANKGNNLSAIKPDTVINNTSPGVRRVDVSMANKILNDAQRLIAKQGGTLNASTVNFGPSLPLPPLIPPTTPPTSSSSTSTLLLVTAVSTPEDLYLQEQELQKVVVKKGEKTSYKQLKNSREIALSLGGNLDFSDDEDEPN